MRRRRHRHAGWLIGWWLGWWLGSLVGYGAAQAAPSLEGAHRPALWQTALPNGGVAYFFGSIHFGRPDFFPFPDPIEVAFANSDTVVVEIDVDNLSPWTLMQKTAEYGLLTPPVKASDFIDPPLWARVVEAAESFSLPVEVIEQQKPWLIVMSLVALALQRRGLDPNTGVEKYFLARRAHREVISLESIDSQLQIFDRLGVQSTNSMLAQTLDDIANPDAVNDLVDAWRFGDDQALVKFSSRFAGPDDIAVRKAIFDDRNTQMTERLASLFKAGGRFFVIVGAGHFVGPANILDQLRERGFDIERVN
ncbi:MAG: TraB/GumN family protein [Pseudomonadota bacterium]